jgi:hypothetical protein
MKLVRTVAATVLLLGGCSTPPSSSQSAEPPDSALCEAYGFQRGTDAYRQCAVEVDKATWRQARSRSRMNCTPMGDRVVCQ